MTIPGEVNRHYSAFDHFVQQQMLNEMVSSAQVSVQGKLMIVDFNVSRSYFTSIYSLQVLYHSQDLHAVIVKNPKVSPSIAIHMYDDRSLCLYYPPDISPFRRIWVYKDLIPMATLWVQHYERWLSNGNDWKGYEAPGHWFFMQQIAYRQKRQIEHLQKVAEQDVIAENLLVDDRTEIRC